MKVYVVETGCYDSEYISGVFDSVEKAMASSPSDKWNNEGGTCWSNGLDLGKAVSITEYELNA